MTNLHRQPHHADQAPPAVYPTVESEPSAAGPRLAAVGGCVLVLMAVALGASRLSPGGGPPTSNRPHSAALAAPSKGDAEARQSGAAKGLDEAVRWETTRQPMIVDVNSDGVSDVVGWTHSRDADSTFVAAFDLASGKQLWVTPTFSSPTAYARAAIVENRLVVADGLGTLRGFAIDSGRPLWEVPIGERARRICGAGPGAIRVDKLDEQKVFVDLATGRGAPAGQATRSDPCADLLTDEALMRRHSRFHVDSAAVQPQIAGMAIDALFTESVSNVWIAVGAREVGTRVPVAAGFAPIRQRRQRDGLFPAWMEPVPVSPLWLAPIPTLDPLTVREGPPPAVAAARDRAFACYDTIGTPAESRLVAFNVSTGRNVWDVPMPAPRDPVCAFTVAASEKYVVAGTGGGLCVFDRETGAYRLTIGRR